MALSTTQTGTTELQIPTRRMAFEDAVADVPRRFAANGDLIASHLIATLSAIFPEGEDFFVRSVRHYRDDVSDPVLRRQVSGFIGQEAVHGREHRVLNDRLAELGYPVRRVERSTRRGLALRERLLSPMSNLAATAALEHFTAMFAEIVMTDVEVREALGHDAVRGILLWHSLEESEHKAVAFDVYRAVGGSERTRIWTMAAYRYIFVGHLAVHTIASLLSDPATYRRRALRQSMAAFLGSPFARAELWARLREYERPGFHPDDRDTTALVEVWRDRLFGDDGELVHLLVKASA